MCIYIYIYLFIYTWIELPGVWQRKAAARRSPAGGSMKIVHPKCHYIKHGKEDLDPSSIVLIMVRYMHFA